jgi:hypothetical protein
MPWGHTGVLRIIAPLIQSFHTTWRRGFNVTLQPVYPRVRNTWYPLKKKLGAKQSGLDDLESRKKFVAPIGNRLHPQLIEFYVQISCTWFCESYKIKVNACYNNESCNCDNQKEKLEWIPCDFSYPVHYEWQLLCEYSLTLHKNASYWVWQIFTVFVGYVLCLFFNWSKLLLAGEKRQSDVTRLHYAKHKKSTDKWIKNFRHKHFVICGLSGWLQGQARFFNRFEFTA